MNIFHIILLIILAIAASLIILFNICDHMFYSSFFRRAQQIKNEAGAFDDKILNENDLKEIPPPVAEFIKTSGLTGRKHISSVHIRHTGTFRPGIDKSFTPITGEYYITTRQPSFCWYGKISAGPGIKVSAFDSYFKGKGRMLIKLLSFFKIADERSPETSLSALARCVAEMSMAPSFFLNRELIRWTSFDAHRADCTIEDSGIKVNASLFFNPDGSFERIEVDRLFDRGKGRFTTEKFTGKGSLTKDFNGIKLASIMDGFWNLPEGDLHYVHFVIEEVEVE